MASLEHKFYKRRIDKMAKYTNTLSLKKPDSEDFFDVSDQNGNMDTIDSAIEGLSQITKSVGTSNAIELSVSHLKSYSNCLKISFVASANNNGTATTVNVNQWGTKNLYKPNTTTAPVLIAGKAYDIWFDEASDCFFLKASAEGDATAAHVLAGTTFSNDDDSGITGTIPSKGAATITPGTTNQTIAAGQYLSGVQTIAGSPNLVASNIKKGVNIFGVVGTVDEEWRFSNTGTLDEVGRINARWESSGSLVWNQFDERSNYNGRVNVYDTSYISNASWSAKAYLKVYQYRGETLIKQLSRTWVSSNEPNGTQNHLMGYFDLQKGDTIKLSVSTNGDCQSRGSAQVRSQRITEYFTRMI